jgi:hypothetical protein
VKKVITSLLLIPLLFIASALTNTFYAKYDGELVTTVSNVQFDLVTYDLSFDIPSDVFPGASETDTFNSSLIIGFG